MKINLILRSRIPFIKFNLRTFCTVKQIPAIPAKDPELGNLIEIQKTSFREYLETKHKELGPIFSFWIKKNKVVSLGHPKYWAGISHLVDRNDHYFMYLRQGFGEQTLLLTNGNPMRERYKTYVTPTFNQDQVYNVHSKILTSVIAKNLKEWTELSKKGVDISIIDTFAKMVLEVIIEVMYGHQGIPQGYTAKQIYQGFTSPSKVGTKDNKGEENLILVKRLLSDLLEAYKQRVKLGQEKKYFVDFLLQEKDDGLITDELVTFFISGVHTSNSLLSLTVFHLAKNPEIQKKLQGFLDEHLKSNVVEDLGQLRGLNFLRACVNETARVTPLVNIATRVDDENDIKFEDGHVIPKGTGIILPLAQILQDPELWNDANTYNPERFRKDGIKFPLQYSPFGFAGGRVCPGKYLALAEIQLAVATIFKNFNVDLAEGQKDPAIKHFTTIFFENEIKVKFNPRH